MALTSVHHRSLRQVACAGAAVAWLGAIPQVHAQRGPDFSQVQIKTTKLAPNFYTLEGQGGTIGVLAGPDGVFMVDSQYAPLTDKIVAAIKAITDGPIRFLVNTHVHPDHTGGNENFANLGVTILARDELRNRLANPGGGRAGQPHAALPMLTYQSAVTLHMNGEDVQLMTVPHAHTDGDTMVYFPTSNVIMTGDFYRSLGYPFFDLNNGGSLPGLLDGLKNVIDLAGPATRIVPGHGVVVDKTAVAAHRDMILAVRAKIAPMVARGDTVEQVVASKPTADYDARVPQGPQTSERFVTALYTEIKNGR
jgi:cyclase